MAVYVVSWNLNKEKANYNAARAAFIAHLERYSCIHDPNLETVWFVESASSAQTVQEDLRTKLDANDRLIVSRMRKGEYSGWLHKDVWAWIDARS